MKKNYFTLLSFLAILSFGFTTLIDASKGTFTVEDKTYITTNSYYHLPNLDELHPGFTMVGRVQETSPAYGNFGISIGSSIIPKSGTYRLKDHAGDGEASLIISTPEYKKNYRAQSGSVQIVNNGSTVTATFSNVPVKSDIGDFESVASGTMTVKLKK
jgi:hypothetical protein